VQPLAARVPKNVSLSNPLLNRGNKIMKRTSNVVWKGSGKQGNGTITSQSKALYFAPYAWDSRFEDKEGTNPEELIAAAHAACFTMKLSFLIEEAGFRSELIETTVAVTLEQNAISHSHITVKATIPGMSKEKFDECATNAKDNCPASKALKMDITMDATLMEKTE
jgi:osmotically inducible protein OsmC